jgi:hypothetical protein
LLRVSVLCLEPLPFCLQESLTNFGINSTALAILSFLVYRDLQAQKKATSVTSREEELGRLLVSRCGVVCWVRPLYSCSPLVLQLCGCAQQLVVLASCRSSCVQQAQPLEVPGCSICD